MTPWLITLLLAAPEFTDPKIKLPLSAKGAEAAPNKPTLIINLNKKGDVKVDRSQEAFGGASMLPAAERGLKVINLDELGEHLRMAQAVYERIQSVKGESGVERVKGSPVGYSPLFVTIRADREARWLHVEWLLAICAEHKYYKTQIAVLGIGNKPSVLPLFLPKDTGFKKLPVHRLRVTVGLFSDEERDLVSYASQTRSWDEFWTQPIKKELRDWLKRAPKPKEEDAFVRVGEIKASGHVPLHQVVSVVSLFRGAGYEHIHAYGSRFAARELRKPMRLPVPKSNTLPRAVHGSGGFGHEPFDR